MTEKVRWRGTWGVGDFMNALNVCHNYSFKNNIKVNLEMHWEHDEDYLHHPDDPETIIERMEWIHSQYHRRDDVTITHVYNSDLFPHGNTNPDKNKKRFYFDSGFSDNEETPPNDWIFKPEAFKPKRTKLVFWTPTYNSEPPRKWKRFLTNDDWYDIIKILSGKGWIPVELTYRTPIRDAFKQIQEADIIVCYDGMWHYIARNFGKPTFVPSWEGITTYNTPQAMKRPSRHKTLDFFHADIDTNIKKMKNKSRNYLDMLKSRYHED